MSDDLSFTILGHSGGVRVYRLRGFLLIPDYSVEDPSPAGRSEQALLNISRDSSFREQFLKVREPRIQLTLRLWPIAGPRR